MSQSYNRRKKEAKKQRSTEEKRIRREIRSGRFPKYMFAKDSAGLEHKFLTTVVGEHFYNGKKYTVKAGEYAAKGLTLRAVSTLKELLK